MLLFLVVVLGVAAVVLLCAWVGGVVGRTQSRMTGQAEDLRRADDGGQPPYSDYGSPMG